MPPWPKFPHLPLNLSNMKKIPPLLFLLLHFIFFFIQTNSQNTESGIPNSPDSVSNFQPSLAVVIGMLAIMFSLTFILLLYAKFCHRAASVHTTNQQIHDGLPRSRSPAAGVDKTVVESLPFFRFSSLKGSRDGLECAVCLAKFEDVDILRLLPKCKHAFHIDCIDQWLDKHSTCPLCRRKVGADDLSQLQCSRSLRFLWNPPPDLRAEDSNLELELHVEREESHCGSSRFCIGSSFRKTDGGGGKEEGLLPIPQSMDCDEPPSSPPPPLHRFNHKIVVADVVLKNRWSNVSSSDIMFLNSEMLNGVSSERFSSLEMRQNEERRENDEEMMMNIKEEMERKRAFEEKVREIKRADHENNIPTTSSDSCTRTKLGFESSSNSLNPNEKRSMSEIVIHPRFTELGNNKDSINVKEERMRRLWLPIARKTVQWFANRERKSSQSQDQLNQQRLNV